MLDFKVKTNLSGIKDIKTFNKINNKTINFNSNNLDINKVNSYHDNYENIDYSANENNHVPTTQPLINDSTLFGIDWEASWNEFVNWITNSSTYQGYDISKLGYKYSDVKSNYGYQIWNDKYYFVMNFKDGKEAWFDGETGKITWLFDRENDISIFFDYDISSEEKQAVYDLYDLDSSVPFDFIATTKIRGHSIKFYSINCKEPNSSEVVKNFSAIYEKHLNDYQLSLLEKYLGGVFVSPWENASCPKLNSYAGGYVENHWVEDKNPFIYIPEAQNREKGSYTTVDFDSHYYRVVVPLHELGHVFEAIFKNKLHNFDLNKWNELHQKYMDLLPKFSCGFKKVMTVEHEFFAEVFLNYCENPIELQRYMPDVYDFIDKLMKGE